MPGAGGRSGATAGVLQTLLWSPVGWAAKPPTAAACATGPGGKALGDLSSRVRPLAAAAGEEDTEWAGDDPGAWVAGGCMAKAAAAGTICPWPWAAKAQGEVQEVSVEKSERQASTARPAELLHPPLL